MKHTLKLSGKLFFVLFMAFVLHACDKTQIETCTEYERDKFLGNYNVSEFCQQGFGHGVTFATVNPGNGSS